MTLDSRFALLVAALALVAPATAAADVDTLRVDTTSDNQTIDDCTNAPNDCSLPGAVSVTHDGDLVDRDVINFAPAIFDGTAASSTIGFPSDLQIFEPLDIGLNCALDKPCVGVNGPDADPAFNVDGGGDLRIGGVAVFDGAVGILHDSSGALEVSNSWFGLSLNGTVSGNTYGVLLSQGQPDQIGGGGLAQNVFVDNAVGVSVMGADDATIQGNLFGVRPNNNLAANFIDIEVIGDGGGGPNDVLIGAEPDGSSECDGDCNVIAAAATSGARGITLNNAAPALSTASNVQILGNHIGVRAGGNATIGSADALIDVGQADDVTVAGNRLAGGLDGIRNDLGAENLLIEDNAIGLNADEDDVIPGPTGTSILTDSSASGPVEVKDNRIARSDPGTAIISQDTGTVISGNEVGIPGLADSGGDRAIRALGFQTQVKKNTVVEATEAIEVFGGEAVVKENVISDMAEVGIELNGADGASIGTDDADDANEIKRVDGDAIRVSGNGDLNSIGVNLGKDAAGLFVDLEGTDGAGNGDASVNGGIEAPEITKAEEKKVKGEGVVGATMFIYKTQSAKNVPPTGLKKLIGITAVDGDGEWKLKPSPKLKERQIVTALQTDPAGNSSELSDGAKVKK